MAVLAASFRSSCLILQAYPIVKFEIHKAARHDTYNQALIR
jgi:hypothetical protein